MINQLNKYLDKVKSSRDTTGDKIRGKARTYSKLNTVIRLPAVTVDGTVPGDAPWIGGSLLIQFNVSMGQDFYITNWDKIKYAQSLRGVVLTVKFREEANVTRYLLAGNNVHYLNGRTLLMNQYDASTKIKKHCSFEIRLQMPSSADDLYQPGVDNIGLIAPLDIQTNILALPTSFSQTEVLSEGLGFVPERHIFPVALPFAQPTIAYLSN
jgi:hypothetical protein